MSTTPTMPTVARSGRRSPRAEGRFAPVLWLALLGVLAFLAFVVAFLPAGVVAPSVERVDGVGLSNLAGSAWRGEADVALRGEPLGRLHWRFEPSALLAGALGLRWRLRHPDHQLEGGFRRGFAGTAASVRGNVASTALNRVLGKYHIRLGGAFDIDELALRDDAGEGRWTARGALRWSGGRTTYRLSGQSYDVDFPPLAAAIGTEADEVRLQAFLGRDPAESPLIDARLDVDGWLHISVTRRFTRLAGKPWPGSGGEDDVVVTVAERVLDASRADKMAH